MSPTSYHIEIAKGEDRSAILKELAAYGTVHDDPSNFTMIVIAYLTDLKAFQERMSKWEASGQARILPIGG